MNEPTREQQAEIILRDLLTIAFNCEAYGEPLESFTERQPYVGREPMAAVLRAARKWVAALEQERDNTV